LQRVAIASDIKRAISGIVRNEDGSHKIFKGKIVKKEEGFLFVAVPDFQKDIFVFRGEVRTKDWPRLFVGGSAELKIGFNYRGPCGADLTAD
jgi:hypothetical protein